jgi:uncharacterized protein DUF5615
VKLYLDEDLSPRIADLLRRHGIDTTSAHDVGNIQVSDRAQLEHATREGRALVTANVVDFIHLAHEAVATNTQHGGIVLVPPSFRRDEFQAIAHAVLYAIRPHRTGLAGIVLYLKR